MQSHHGERGGGGWGEGREDELIIIEEVTGTTFTSSPENKVDPVGFKDTFAVMGELSDKG